MKKRHTEEQIIAILPYVDDFLPVHNVTSLRELSKALATSPQRAAAS